MREISDFFQQPKQCFSEDMNTHDEVGVKTDNLFLPTQEQIVFKSVGGGSFPNR